MAQKSDSKFCSRLVLAASLAAMIAPGFLPVAMAEDMPAKRRLSVRAIASMLARQPQSIGFYAKGCLAGAVALPTDG